MLRLLQTQASHCIIRARRRLLSTAARRKQVKPHGPTGALQSLVLAKDQAVEAKYRAIRLPELVLSKRQLCDIELILNGGFTPLDGFMCKKDYERCVVANSKNHFGEDSVVHNMRMADNTLFPMPITLDVSDVQAQKIEASGQSQVALKDEEGNIIAVMDINEIYTPSKDLEAKLVFGGDPEHPAIQYLMHHAGTRYIGGKLTGLQLPPHYDHRDLRQTPAEVRAFFDTKGWQNVVAFQTRNPLHRAHFELTVRACEEFNARLLLHPVVGMTKPGDIDHHTRVKCYRRVMHKYADDQAMLSALPLAMRMAGPREAVWHAIIRKNYGASHFIIGRDHAGPGANSRGKDFYAPYEARDFALQFQSELGIQLCPFEMMVYVPQEHKYYPVNAVPKGRKTENLSGTEVRRRLATGTEIPAWFSFPEVASILRAAHPPRCKQGFCVFFTGLSGSGKTTVANALMERLMEIDDRRVTLLDGDHVRQVLSSELGFSKEHRNLNIVRIGYVAGEVVKPGGAVIACPIAPYEHSRKLARQSVEKNGGFVEVHLNTSVEVCEQRDRKGLYKKARSGLLKHFTGIDDPYEVPHNPEVVINTGTTDVLAAVDQIVKFLEARGYLKPNKT